MERESQPSARLLLSADFRASFERAFELEGFQDENEGFQKVQHTDRLWAHASAKVTDWTFPAHFRCKANVLPSDVDPVAMLALDVRNAA